MTKEECPQCQAFDAETRDLLSKLFSSDELILLTMLMAASLKIQTIQMQRLDRNDMVNRMRVQRDSDFAGAIIGKFLVGFSPEHLDFVLKRVQKDHGMSLVMKNENCPHITPEPVPQLANVKELHGEKAEARES